MNPDMHTNTHTCACTTVYIHCQALVLFYVKILNKEKYLELEETLKEQMTLMNTK